MAVARRLGIGGEELDELSRAATLHDVGKVGLPAGEELHPRSRPPIPPCRRQRLPPRTRPTKHANAEQPTSHRRRGSRQPHGRSRLPMLRSCCNHRRHDGIADRPPARRYHSEVRRPVGKRSHRRLGRSRRGRRALGCGWPAGHMGMVEDDRAAMVRAPADEYFR
ncbi:MAG: hypothetical protein ACLP50_14830 [Solirubrobacteraceae bacterium]